LTDSYILYLVYKKILPDLTDNILFKAR